MYRLKTWILWNHYHFSNYSFNINDKLDELVPLMSKLL